MELDASVTTVKGVGPAVGQKLAKLGVHTIADLLGMVPRKYDNYAQITSIKALKPGAVTIRAKISQVTGSYRRRGMHITECIASDNTGSVRVIWFNQPYRAASLRTEEEYFVSGVFQLSHGRMSIANPTCERASDFPINTARIVPVYRETKGLASHQLRRFIAALLENTNIAETLPDWLLKTNHLVSRDTATRQIHFPNSEAALEAARHRLGFEEVFELTLAALLNKQTEQTESAMKIPFNTALARQFVDHLSFTLTDDQKRAVWQIYQDIAQPTPMNRLVQGDVGSGKTVVAAMGALMAVEQGFQVVLMAPTELLARQHAQTIYDLLEPLGFADHVGLLVGSLKTRQKSTVQQRIKSGDVRFIVGTHAVIQQQVDFAQLALVIIDEQHRFGVEQRRALQKKTGHAVHVLNMTATPIPRSLCLTLYGELDISTIHTRPVDRKRINTQLVPPSDRLKIYKQTKILLDAGQQAFVVCPTIDSEQQISRTAQHTFTELSQGAFKNYRLGLLHGRLSAEEKATVMQDYLDKKIDLLVATTVIEVGVDVPNATLMLVENPERFGLAQLHQLRGRVGRGKEQGHCYLMLSDAAEPSPRLKALERSADGFQLAELDLRLRGPGAIYGTQQHGVLDLRIATLADNQLIAQARNAAEEFIAKEENLVHYKHLHERIERLQAITNLN